MSIMLLVITHILAFLLGALTVGVCIAVLGYHLDGPLTDNITKASGEELR
jgi:uncharacterized membrane protein